MTLVVRVFTFWVEKYVSEKLDSYEVSFSNPTVVKAKCLPFGALASELSEKC